MGSLNTTKARLLAVERYLRENTAEDCPATMAQMLEWLSSQGVEVNRKTVHDDLEVLRESGMDIVEVRSSPVLYYLGERRFSLSELHLLMDAVAAARFITSEKSGELIGKLADMGGAHNREKLERHLYRPERIRTGGEQLYTVLNVINAAITRKRKLAFQYVDYLPNKQRQKRYNGEESVCSPYSLLWNEDRYYMLAYSDRRGQVESFRVDRMISARILTEPQQTPPEGFDVDMHVRGMFKMFGGETEKVVLECDNCVMNSVVDHFGEEVDTRITTAETFEVRTDVAVSPTFFGWVFQFGGKIRIKDPKPVREHYEQMLKSALEGKKII